MAGAPGTGWEEMYGRSEEEEKTQDARHCLMPTNAHQRLKPYAHRCSPLLKARYPPLSTDTRCPSPSWGGEEIHGRSEEEEKTQEPDAHYCPMLVDAHRLLKPVNTRQSLMPDAPRCSPLLKARYPPLSTDTRCPSPSWGMKTQDKRQKEKQERIVYSYNEVAWISDPGAPSWVGMSSGGFRRESQPAQGGKEMHGRSEEEEKTQVPDPHRFLKPTNLHQSLMPDAHRCSPMPKVRYPPKPDTRCPSPSWGGKEMHSRSEEEEKTQEPDPHRFLKPVNTRQSLMPDRCSPLPKPQPKPKPDTQCPSPSWGKALFKDGKRFVRQKLNEGLSIIEKAGSLKIYRMLLNCVNSQQIWEFGTPKPNKQNKVIMMVGETGSGKTALINTMVNFILGADWKDDHRIQLIEDIGNKSQAHSQTSSVTIYQIHHEDYFRIPYSITIIDTPGFGDTRGIDHDEKIMRKIREFFQKCKFTKIAVVCFVVKSSSARLTPTQRYIYDNILFIFGNDIKDNIIFFTTFADVQEPNVLSAIMEADLPCAKSEDGKPVYFSVNNSMVYANNCPDKPGNRTHKVQELQWEMGMENIKNFLLDFLPGIASKDLSLTKEVLKERNALEVTLDGLVQKIEEVIFKRHELVQTERALNEHKVEVEKNEHFQMTVMQCRKEKIESSEHSTNCNECRSTCHKDCLVYFNPFVYFCEVFNKKGNCCVCGHSTKVHSSEKSYYKTSMVLGVITFPEIKKKYEEGGKKLMPLEYVLQKLEDEVQEAENEALELIHKVNRILQRLQEIALKPNSMSALDYIQLLIEKENQERKDGFRERIKMLEKAIKRFNLISNIQSQDAVLDNLIEETARAFDISE
ncbi:uncharacterized protein [Aquarana catesbeiana]|uniref:uncharacterized protein n=1 Tax=Aquarana catesbeiana TaxID=8400 RepID=UPI003CC99FA1